jgi:hypothetical protein
LTGETYFAEEVVVGDVAIAKALTLRAHIPASEGVLLLIAALPELLFLVQYVVA